MYVDVLYQVGMVSDNWGFDSRSLLFEREMSTRSSGYYLPNGDRELLLGITLGV